MFDLKAIRSLTFWERVGIVTAVIGNLAPGVLTIWAFNPALIVDLTTPKLILLALSITGITSFANMFFLFTTEHPQIPKGRQNIFAFSMSCLGTLFAFLVALGFKFAKDISLGQFVGIVIVINIFFVMVGLVVGKLPDKKAKQKDS